MRQHVSLHDCYVLSVLSSLMHTPGAESYLYHDCNYTGSVDGAIIIYSYDCGSVSILELYSSR